MRVKPTNVHSANFVTDKSLLQPSRNWLYVENNGNLVILSLLGESHFLQFADLSEPKLREPAVLEAYAAHMIPSIGSVNDSYSFDTTPAYFDGALRGVDIATRSHGVMRGGMRLVLVLRDPVERFHSNVNMDKSYEEYFGEKGSELGVGDLDKFQEVMTACEDKIISEHEKNRKRKNPHKRPTVCASSLAIPIERSMYSRWLRRWALLHEAAGPIHLVLNSDLKEPGKVLNRTARWLGVPEYAEKEGEFDKLFKRKGSKVKLKEHEALAKVRSDTFFSDGGGNSVLRKLYSNVDRRLGELTGNYDLVTMLRMYSDATEEQLEEVRGWYSTV
ncbi:hypothetical protein TrST_g4070 [Triparma strigata]|uniref:Sulfotransferase n=1 Tax=Triparma strigata TaxID=1606541 RepID=A0A9W7EXH1_9STRA|nr:hypothetical protein TrST_g4070 [Triparma strigata]